MMNNKKVEDNYEKMLNIADVIVKGEDATDIEIEKAYNDIQKLNSDDELEDYTPTEEDLELEKVPQKIDVVINPDGKINNVLAMKTPNVAKDNFDKLMSMSPEEVKLDVDIERENVVESLKNVFPGSDATFPYIKQSDIDMFIHAIDRYRKGEKFSYYNALPKPLQDYINTLIGTSGIGQVEAKTARNYVAQGLFDQVINDNYTNIMFNDLQASIDESYNELYESTKGEFSKYNNRQRYIFEEKMLEVANEVEAENPEKAETLRKSSANFIQAHTYTDMLELYKKGKLKVKVIEVDKFDRTCRSFLAKYENSKFIINDVREALPTILTAFDNKYDERTVKTFLVAFTKYAQNMKPDVIEDHVFMYYFIKNIISLSYYNVDDEEETKFYDDLKVSIRTFLDAIVEKIKK